MESQIIKIGFDRDVANDAITSAKGIKSDADIYTIGVFDSANASDTTGRFNAYMHGMSSNYPNATAYYNLGERRAPKAQLHSSIKQLTDASDVKRLSLIAIAGRNRDLQHCLRLMWIRENRRTRAATSPLPISWVTICRSMI